MQGAYDLFYELFLSPEISSYFGPLGLIVVGYFVAKKDKMLGVLYFAVECLIIAQYLALVEATPAYWWHSFILIFGMLFTIIPILMDK